MEGISTERINMKNNNNYIKVKEAKNIIQSIIDNNDVVEDALREIVVRAWSIRHSDYALFRAMDAVFETATITEDLRWGYNFYMPATADVLDWMRKFSRKTARKDERYRKERGI